MRDNRKRHTLLNCLKRIEADFFSRSVLSPFLKRGPIGLYLGFVCVLIILPQGWADSSRSLAKKGEEPCGQDSFEPNDRRSRARNLSAELKNTREISGKVCAGDHDWYTVWINRGELVEFIISSPLETAPNLSVFAPRRRKSSGVIRTSAPSTRRVRVYAKQSGRYRLHISPKREATARYTLSLHRPSH